MTRSLSQTLLFQLNFCLIPWCPDTWYDVISANTHYISFFSNSERTSLLSTRRITQVPGYLQIRQPWYTDGFRVHAIQAFHWLKGNLSPHVMEPMIALLEVGLVGAHGRAWVSEILLNHFLPCSKVNKCQCRGDSLLFVTAFQHVFNTLHTEYRKYWEPKNK